MSTSLLEQWAERAGMTLPSRGPGIVHGWGDMETSYDVREEPPLFVFMRADHGFGRPMASFSSLVAADRLLLLQLGLDWRSANGMPQKKRAGLAAGCAVAPDGDWWRLSWPGGDARFAREAVARQYSTVATMSLEVLGHALKDPAWDF